MISIASAMLTLSRDAITQAVSPIDIGNRLELFVDDYLIDQIAGATQRLHIHTTRVACVHDNRWEGSTCGYKTVFQDGDLYRMYYRGSHVIYTQKALTMTTTRSSLLR